MSGKPHKTGLEKFCGGLSLKKVGQIFDGEPNSLGLVWSFSLLLLHLANGFLEDAAKNSLVGPGKEQPRPNVVIFEVAMFLHSIVQAPVLRWAEDELGLDSDHELCNNVSATYGFTYKLIERHWPGVSLERYTRSRLYLGTMDEKAEELSDWLWSSAGSEVPASSLQRSLDISKLPLAMSCKLFAQYAAPAVVKALKFQMTFLVGGS